MKHHRPVKVVRSGGSAGEGVVANVAGNYYDKHGATNPLVRRLMARFHAVLLGCIAATGAETILDVGCGEGHTTEMVSGSSRAALVGVELEESALRDGQNAHPGLLFVCGSAYELPFRAGSFDLVMATEMLEHLDNPAAALRELARTSAAWCLVTVPNEPWWRLANIARGAYLSDFGNTPGHVQHWTRRSLRRFLHETFMEVTVTRAAMWNVALCRNTEHGP
jgi:2-polyprenyl-3-methyl-5-hydroxy-6-metoxy-1,4-benzoquinol methylase